MRVTSFLLISVAVCAQSDALLTGVEQFHKGLYADAERSLRAAGNDPRAKAFLALTLAATNRCTAAEPDLKNASETGDPEIGRLAGLALAQCRISSGRLDDAGTLLSALRAKYPSDADVLYLSARLHMRAWNDSLYQLYKSNPASYRVNQISGEVLETQGQFAEAAGEYRKAIAKNPQALALHYRLGRALLMSSHDPSTLDAAQVEFENELRLNPRDSIAEYQVGQILQAKQNPDEAAVRLQRALEVNPEFPEALVALGKLRAAQKRYDDAISLLQKAVGLAPNSEPARYALMMLYRDAGRTAEARQQKAELDKLQKVPEGEFTEFLKRIGEKPRAQ